MGRALDLPFWDNFVFAIGVIVANVPEGLLPTLTLSMAMGAQRMAARRTSCAICPPSKRWVPPPSSVRTRRAH